MFLDGGVDRRPAPELEETNYIEPETEPVRDREPQPRAQTPDPSPNDNLERNQVLNTEQMCKQCSENTTSLHVKPFWECTSLLVLKWGCKSSFLFFIVGQQVDCETKLRDQCKGTTCNR